MRNLFCRIKCIAIPITVLMVFCCSCALLPVEEDALPPPVFKPHENKIYETILVTRGDIISVNTVGARLVPAQTDTYSFGIDASRQPEIFVEEGQVVKQGDVLAQFNVQHLTDELKNQNNNLQDAELQLTHWSEKQEIRGKIAALSKRSGAMESYLKEKESIELNIALIREQIAFTQQNIDNHTIYAEMDGVVDKVFRKKSVWDYYVKNTNVLMVSDSSDTLFEIRSPESKYFEENEEIVVADGDLRYEAVIITVDEENANLDKTSKYAKLIESTDDIVNTNQFYIAKTVVDLRDILYVPYQSVRRTGERAFVYVLERGVKVARDVELGVNVQGYFQILSGLTEGEVVIVKE